MLKSEIQILSHSSSKIFPFIVMLLLTFSVASMVLAYKTVGVWGITITGSALVMPLRYIMGDIITELYGYYVAKRMIIYLIVCWFVFSLLTIAVIHYLPQKIRMLLLRMILY